MKSRSPITKAIIAANLSCEDAKQNKVTRRICLIGMIMLLIITLAVIV